MNPRQHVVTAEGKAKHTFLALINASAPAVPLNARLVLVDDLKSTRAFRAWFDAAYPGAPAMRANEDIVTEGGYPSDYLLTVAAEVGW